MASNIEIEVMAKLIDLAAQQRGRTAPNPVTAAAIVLEDKLISTGVHKGAGHPHAEIEAINAAGPAVKSATLLVNLEPCTHHGKTPPCTQAIVAAGISRVVYAMTDPNPKVRARPAAAVLEAAGLSVERNILTKEASMINDQFAVNITENRAFLSLKLGQSLDGKIALANGESKYITGAGALETVHALRAQHDAIMVGAGTINVDDPRLDIRFGPDDRRKPLKKIIISGQGNLNPNAQIFTLNQASDILVFTAKGTTLPTEIQAKCRHNALPIEDGVVAWHQMLRNLYKDGIYSVMVEGGETLASALLDHGAVDRCDLFVAPKFIGGKMAKQSYAGAGTPRLSDAIHLQHVNTQVLGEDLWIRGYPNERLSKVLSQ